MKRALKTAPILPGVKYLENAIDNPDLYGMRRYRGKEILRFDWNRSAAPISRRGGARPNLHGDLKFPMPQHRRKEKDDQPEDRKSVV